MSSSICPLTGSSICPQADQEVSWDTQVAYPGARLDMLAQWPGVAILFEHKVHAALSREQLQRYREVANQQFPKRVHTWR